MIHKALTQLYQHQKCLESEILTNQIYTEKTYWLKVDTWIVQRKRDEQTN